MTITKLEPRTWQEIVVALLDMQKEGCYYQKLLRHSKASNSEIWHVRNLLLEKGMILIAPGNKGIKAILLTRQGFALALSLKAADEALKQGKIAGWLEPAIEDAMKFSRWGGKNEI